MHQGSASRPVRLVVDTDAANEADDQFAIAHALLTPSFDLRAILPSHFPGGREPDSQRASADEIMRVLRLVGRTDVPVPAGADGPLDRPDVPHDTPAARALIAESRLAAAAGDRLVIAALGNLTNIASALLLEPELARRDVVLIWIGGPPYDGLAAAYWPEYNLSGDRFAANVVFGSGIRIWQVPMTVYTRVGVGYAELRARVAPHGELGRYLAENLIEWNRRWDPEAREFRSLGDSPAIGLAINPRGGVWRERGPVRFDEHHRVVDSDAGRPVRVYEEIDVRYLLEDFYAKLAQHAAEATA